MYGGQPLAQKNGLESAVRRLLQYAQDTELAARCEQIELLDMLAYTTTKVRLHRSIEHVPFVNMVLNGGQTRRSTPKLPGAAGSRITREERVLTLLPSLLQIFTLLEGAVSAMYCSATANAICPTLSDSSAHSNNGEEVDEDEDKDEDEEEEVKALDTLEAVHQTKRRV